MAHDLGTVMSTWVLYFKYLIYFVLPFSYWLYH